VKAGLTVGAINLIEAEPESYPFGKRREVRDKREKRDKRDKKGNEG
jgi:hypothetical protein